MAAREVVWMEPMVGTVPQPEVPLARITCAKYHAMIESGALTEQDRLELINGHLVQKMPIGPNHAGVVKALNFLLSRQIGDRAIVAVQDPVTLGEYSQPEPDVVIVRFRSDFYRSSHPGPEDVLLVVEVADSSFHYDLNTKIPLYAAAGIPEAWLVDLTARSVSVFSRPKGESYGRCGVYTAGGEIKVAAFPDVSVAVADLGL